MATNTTPQPQPTTDLLRHGDLATLVGILNDQAARKHDVIVPARDLLVTGDGMLTIPVVEHELSLDGVTDTMSMVPFNWNATAAAHLADRTGIPFAYWQRMANDDPTLLATNVNHWLAQDDRSFMVRSLLASGDRPGYVRAVMSDRYAAMDYLDTLMAVLDGVRAAGVDVTVNRENGGGVDLTERRMHVKIVAPQVAVAAQHLLGKYRSPFSGASGNDLPLLFAGISITNSEVGHGSFTVAPRIVVQVCKNGMTRTQDVLRKVHVGGQQAEGVVRWSLDTQKKRLDVLVAEVRDAVQQFLTVDYLAHVVADMEAAADTKVTKPQQAIEVVAKGLGYTKAQQEALLTHFIDGGDTSLLGIAHAITSVAQTVEDADQAADMEADCWKALDLARSTN
jgi:hypothetical protein